MASPESLIVQRLKKLQPLNRLTDEQLILLANRCERKHHTAGQRVLHRGDQDGLEYFLLEGTVDLCSADGRNTCIEAETEKALNAVARLQPRMYDVTAVSACEFLVVNQGVLAQMLRSAPIRQVEMESLKEESGAGEGHRLLMEFYAELRSNQLSLPSVPDVAWKVRRAADREDSTAEQIAQVITADPAMAAKLVRACNSPLYRGFNDIRNVRETVVRLGTRTTRQLVTVFSMREVFKTRQPELQKLMDRLWRHSREVAALCWVLADRVTRLNPEEALLAGLLHDIGTVPVLVRAENHAIDPGQLQSAIAELRGDVGAAVLENWEFPAAFVEAARHAEDWHYESGAEAPQLVDVVIVAQLHAMIGSDQGVDLPAFEAVPAYHRLGGLELNASRSLQILTQARARVDEVHRLLSIH